MTACTFEGKLLPLFKFENDLNRWLRVFLYLFGLGWLFCGVGIISDVFMNGIEKITSKKTRKTNAKTGRVVTYYVWNPTVANLTLMALGSSAPEILLSLIEILLNDMYLGDLGAGTIVGSAAFNLLIISAVCIVAIPDTEVRYIKQTTVYIITATTSVFAYVWLMFILQAWTPNVCTIEEGIITLLFAPLMVFLAFLADKGYFDRNADAQGTRLNETVPENVTRDELAQIEQTIREENKGVDLTPDQVLNIMISKYFTVRSRAYYAHLSRKGDKKRHSLHVPLPEFNVVSAPPTSDCAAEERSRKDIFFGFQFAQYAFLENCGNAKITVTRSGYESCKATVKYKTRDGTANSVEDYEAKSGELVFLPGELTQQISIKIHDDNAYEENEEFFIDLSEPAVEEAGITAKLGDTPVVTVVIIDDDTAGTIKFESEEIKVFEDPEGTTAKITVVREDGASGTVTCAYATEDMTAIAKMDYQETSGVLEMGPTVQSMIIEVPIMPKGRFNNDASFNVRLSDPKGAVFDKTTDGGAEFCICHVIIKGKTNETRINMLQRMESRINSQNALLGHRHWRQQFYDALFTVVDDDDGDDDDDAKDGDSAPGVFDYVMHAITLPWKLLFAFVPPTDYCDGWVTFAVSLAMIGLVTALVGDMANLLGDCIGLNPEITAITFVALGTSLPDTFASKTAACMDEYADASIGNITGSNSVNVFLGLGISWTMAAFYWQTKELDSDYVQKVVNPDKDIGIYYSVREDVANLINVNDPTAKGVFIAPAGSLWFNLMVFSLNAFAAIQHLWARRRKWGGELGGPKHGVMGQYFSAGWLCCQWIIYIGASSIYATIHEND
jgi:solute carrier family 8 (sodium/calcium exchanger)